MVRQPAAIVGDAFLGQETEPKASIPSRRLRLGERAGDLGDDLAGVLALSGAIACELRRFPPAALLRSFRDFFRDSWCRNFPVGLLRFPSVAQMQRVPKYWKGPIYLRKLWRPRQLCPKLRFSKRLDCPARIHRPIGRVGVFSDLSSPEEGGRSDQSFLRGRVREVLGQRYCRIRRPGERRVAMSAVPDQRWA
jgi:hypothetical protein